MSQAFSRMFRFQGLGLRVDQGARGLGLFRLEGLKGPEGFRL